MIIQSMRCLTILTLLFSVAILNAQEIPSLADKQFEMGVYDVAAKSYKEQIQTNVNDYDLYNKLATCYDRMNQPEKAIAIYEQMSSKFDLSAGTYINWASALKKSGHANEAQALIALGQSKITNFSVDGLSAPRTSSREFTVKPVGFNSKLDDFAPTMLGNDVIFVSNSYNAVVANSVSTSTLGKPNILIRYSALTGERTQFRGKMKDFFNDGPSAFSEETMTVAYSKGQFAVNQSPKLGNRKSGSIYMADMMSNGDWMNTTSLPFNELGVANIYPNLTSDARKLYFASNREGGYGGFDLYVTERVADGWTSPKNLGSQINTEGDEISPMIDGSVLFFASDRLPGYGGFDLFVKDFQTNNKPINLGKSINSTWDDYALTTTDAGNSGYFNSNRPGGKGGEDIYQFAALNPNEDLHTWAVTANANQPIAPASSNQTYKELQPKYDFGSSEPVATMVSISTEKQTTINVNERKKTIFSIQVAALSKTNPSYYDLAKRLSSVGHVYKVFYEDMIKVRVGQYTSETTARNVLADIKTLGYKDAFVVREELFNGELERPVQEKKQEYVPEERIQIQAPVAAPKVYTKKKYVSSNSSQATMNAERNESAKTETIYSTPVIKEEIQTTYSTPVIKEETQAIIETPIITNIQEQAVVTSETVHEVVEQPREQIDSERLKDMPIYRVKLGAYTNMADFDSSKVEKFGTIYREKMDDWTIVFIGDYVQIEDAEAIRMACANQGFNSAKIYGVRNGELFRVE